MQIEKQRPSKQLCGCFGFSRDKFFLMTYLRLLEAKNRDKYHGAPVSNIINFQKLSTHPIH
jgi:hypothetical protein